jgi:hypothetical protein
LIYRLFLLPACVSADFKLLSLLYDREFRVFNAPGLTYSNLLADEKAKRPLRGNLHVIKDALGHSESRTTEIYLKALDDERLDKEMDKLYGE